MVVWTSYFRCSGQGACPSRCSEAGSICGTIISGVGKDEQRLREVSVACGWKSGEIRAPEVKEVRRGDVRYPGRGHHVVYPAHTYSKCDKKPLEPRVTWADFPLKSNTLASLWRTDSKGAKMGERKTSWMEVEELRQKSWRR